MKYSTIKQRGEMSYEQPTFFVRLTTAEVAQVVFNDLALSCTEFLQVTTDLETLVSSSRRYTVECKASVQLYVVPVKWRKKYMDNSPMIIADERAYYVPHFAPIPTANVKTLRHIAVIHPNCFADVAAAANFFGDRLLPRFYEHYSKILVELPES